MKLTKAQCTYFKFRNWYAAEGYAKWAAHHINHILYIYFIRGRFHVSLVSPKGRLEEHLIRVVDPCG